MDRNMHLFIFYLLSIVFIITVFLLFHKKKCKQRKIHQINAKRINKIIHTTPIEKKIVVDNADINYYMKNAILIEAVPHQTALNFDQPMNILDDIGNYDLVDEIYEERRNNIMRNPQDVFNMIINRPDSQNVHDSVIQNTIKNKFKIKRIENERKHINKNDKDIISEIINRANTIDKEKYEKIPDILKQISSRCESVYNLEADEINVLKNTWISASDVQKDQILNELLDCLENNKLVCPTGVVSRIINSDIVINPENAPKTIENLREEMMNIAIKTRNDLEDTEEFQNKEIPEQNLILKDELIRKYEETYKGILDEDIVKNEYDKWIDSI